MGLRLYPIVRNQPRAGLCTLYLVPHLFLLACRVLSRSVAPGSTVQSPYQMVAFAPRQNVPDWDMFVRATCFPYIDFLDIDGLINLEVGKKTCSVLKQRGCATRELFGNRRVDSRKRDKEKMPPFGTGTELCIGDGMGKPAQYANTQTAQIRRNTQEYSAHYRREAPRKLSDSTVS